MCIKVHVCGKDYFWNRATCNFENEKYIANIMNDSTIICDEVIDENDETNFIEKKAIYKM